MNEKEPKCAERKYHIPISLTVKSVGSAGTRIFAVCRECKAKIEARIFHTKWENRK